MIDDVNGKIEINVKRKKLLEIFPFSNFHFHILNVRFGKMIVAHAILSFL